VSGAADSQVALGPGGAGATGLVAPGRVGLKRRKSAYAGDLRTIFFGAMRVADELTVLLTGMLSYWARNGVAALPTDAWWEIVAGCLIAANALALGQAYNFASLRRRSRHLSALALAWTASVLVMIALLFFTKLAGETSRAWMLMWAVTSLAGFIVLRTVCWAWLGHWRRRGIFAFEVAVVGDEGPAERLARRIEETGEGDVHVLGIFRPRITDGSETAGDLAHLMRLSRSVRVDEIAVAIPCSTPLELNRVLRTLGTLPADIKLCVDLPNEGPLGLGVLNPPMMVLSTRPLAGWQMIIKRAMDIVISTALILLCAPVMLLTAALVMCDSRGPVIFRQQRFGFNQQPITVFKFRTMYVAAGADPSVPQAKRHDPRVTRVGRFLRSTSLDELPQLLNVLAGDMSLVGPRPHAIAHDEYYAQLLDGYLGRHRVKPGITGWAQVRGYRGETDTIEKMRGRVEHDLFYIGHWSPLLDLRILAMTALVGFSSRNAY
jgi:putative colanic acid biosynthesis UDP-glucose lipid carrier transferase